MELNSRESIIEPTLFRLLQTIPFYEKLEDFKEEVNTKGFLETMNTMVNAELVGEGEEPLKDGELQVFLKKKNRWEKMTLQIWMLQEHGRDTMTRISISALKIARVIAKKEGKKIGRVFLEGMMDYAEKKGLWE